VVNSIGGGGGMFGGARSGGLEGEGGVALGTLGRLRSINRKRLFWIRVIGVPKALSGELAC